MIIPVLGYCVYSYFGSGSNSLQLAGRRNGIAVRAHAFQVKPNRPALRVGTGASPVQAERSSAAAAQAAKKVGVALDFGWRSGSPLR